MEEEQKIQELIKKRAEEELSKYPAPTEEEVQRFSRCHPINCPLAWMYPMWHPTPPHVPLYPSDWC